MGLAETLAARAARQGRSATVTCGELGTVTVEALPVRELELLLRGSDGDRAVFYAACRELQSAGEELRQAGQVFAPDEVMQLVSDSEAAEAARTVLELSGQTEENRLQIVQEKTGLQGESRPAIVQQTEPAGPLTDENRLESVQFNGASAPGFGQVSREAGAGSAKPDTVPESDKKAQAMGILPPERTQNVGPGQNPRAPGDGSGEGRGVPLHEITSEFGEGLHEITSEFRGRARETAHETMSEFGETLHEIKSDFGGMRRGIPHESKSEFGKAVHESTSEFGETAHETTSEFPVGLHETTSALAEAVARRLVEGLRRAKWVRGD